MEGSINMDLEEQVVLVGTQELGRVEERKVGTGERRLQEKAFHAAPDSARVQS